MSYSHEKDVLDVLEVLLDVVRSVKKDNISTYQLDLRNDGDRVVAKTNGQLAKLYAEGKIDAELRIIHQHLHSGDCIVYREVAKNEKYPEGEQSCLDKIRGLLMQTAKDRQFDDNPGRVLGHTAEEIEKMTAPQLEEFRKAVCRQSTGGIQLENKVFYYLGNNLEVGKDAGAGTFVHKAIGRRFREVNAIWKDPEMKRTYWIQFEKRTVSNTLREAHKELKTHAEMAEKRRKEAAEKKLKAKQKAEAEAAAVAAEAEKNEQTVEQTPSETEETIASE